MRTRFPPEPNGPLHIGHLKAMLADYHGLEPTDVTGTYRLKEGLADCHLRFDDTNPEEERSEYYTAIMRDMNWLGFSPGDITATSDYFNILYRFMRLLLERREAYLDFSTGEEIAEQRATGTPSPWRDREPDLTELGVPVMDKRACIRIKIDPAHPVSCMRDPTIYRYKCDNWYPTYDFSHPLVDYLEGITHSYCTSEFYVRRQLYYWLIKLYIHYDTTDAAGDRSYHSMTGQIPTVLEFGRLNIEGVTLSKRNINQMIKAGTVNGYDDPSLFTIAGLRARGHEPGALLHFCRNYVRYTAGEDGTIPLHTFEHAVREYYDANAPRAFGIPESKALMVKILPDDEYVWINEDDFNPDGNAKYKRIKANGNKVWLKGHYLVTYVGHAGSLLTVRKLDPTDHPGRHAAIQWVTAVAPLKFMDTSGELWICSHDLTENNKITGAPDTPGCGCIFQFERCGYYRLRNYRIHPVISLKSGFHDS